MPITNPILIVCCNVDDLYLLHRIWPLLSRLHIFALLWSFLTCFFLLDKSKSLFPLTFCIFSLSLPQCHPFYAYIHSMLLLCCLWGFCFLVFIFIFRKRKGKLKGQKFVFKTTSKYFLVTWHVFTSFWFVWGYCFLIVKIIKHENSVKHELGCSNEGHVQCLHSNIVAIGN